jgi:hypothetical protein
MSLETYAAAKLREVAARHREDAVLLEAVAYRLDGLDKFVRRDNGSKTNEGTIEARITEVVHEGVPAIVATIDAHTESLRQTILAYIRGQFDEKAISGSDLSSVSP